jgi:hypothetical protein
MKAVELATYRVPNDVASPVPTGGYVVACAVFYERGFGVPSHRFLHSLLQFYGLELHHLMSSGILHVAAFVMSPTSICGTTSFTPSSYWAQVQKRWFWMAWTSM